MHRAIIVLLITCVPLMGCGKKKAAGPDKCKKAQTEAAEKWTEASKAWAAVHKAWADKTLISRVQKAMEKRAGGGLGAAKVEADMVTLKAYVKFKVDHAETATKKSARAAKSAVGDVKKARKTSGRAFVSSADPSGNRYNKAKWFTEPAIVKIDESQRKAYNLSTEARNLSRQADAACAK